MQTRPRTVFKYQPLSLLTLLNLKKQSIHFASPKQFNDPYDCAITAAIDDLADDEICRIRDSFIRDTDASEADCDRVRENLRTADLDALRTMVTNGVEVEYEKAKEEFLANRGVACFSESIGDLLMWSHYGDSHKGFCLEFDTDYRPFTDLKQVRYVNEIPTVNLCDVIVDDRWDELLEPLYCTKSVDWAYEKEWRVIHKVAGTLYTYEADALKAIHFGPKIDPQIREIICLILKGQNPNVELWQAVQAKNRFELTFQKISSFISHAEAKERGLI